MSGDDPMSVWDKILSELPEDVEVPDDARIAVQVNGEVVEGPTV